MPVESAPTLRSAADQRPGAHAPVDRLIPVDLAPGEVVEPLLRSARSAVASLTLQARSAEQAARRAEQITSSDEAFDLEAVEAEQAARLAAVEVDLEARRQARDAAVEKARLEAETILDQAREDGRALVAAAREELDRSLDGLSGPASATVAAATFVTIADLADDRSPEPTRIAPPEPEPSFPPPAAAPSYPPPSAAPTLPPPMMAAPLGGSFTPTFTTVLVQAPDGTLQQMLMLTPGGFAAPASIAPVVPTPAPLPALMPAAPGATQLVAAPMAPMAVAPPAPAIPVQEVAPVAPAAGAGRRLLHLDVILPLIAVAIVLVVLLAWLG